ncbi:MAG: response regulator transcription factor [Eubacterium sp.]|nr:response regulator transcription factor [Eubacterium sp.]
MKRILITEDEPEIREVLYNYLVNEGFEVDMAEDGVQALSMFSANAYDIVLLDIMIPKIDGYNVCEVIKKQSDVPVVFLSALSDDKSQIKGYDLMADDYVTKPFSMPVLVRKIKVLLRRNERETSKEKIIECGDLIIDPDMMEVRVKDKIIELTSKEFDILTTLAKNPGRIYTREILLDLLWDYNSLVDERIVDSHIKNLRHKLGGDYIETVRGRGYRIAKKDI